MHYLCRKCASQSIAVPIIAEIDLYKYDPWDLPGNCRTFLQIFSVCRFFSLYRNNFDYLVYLQVWPCMGRRSGTSFRLGTGSTQTDLGRTGRPGPDTGRLPEQISQLDSRNLLESRRLWYFTQGKLPKEKKQTGLCTNIAWQMWIARLARRTAQGYNCHLDIISLKSRGSLDIPLHVHGSKFGR